MAGFVLGFVSGSLTVRFAPELVRYVQDKRLKRHVVRDGQSNLLAGLAGLPKDQQLALMDEIKGCDLPYINSIFTASMNATKETPDDLTPMQNVTTIKGTSSNDTKRWTTKGYELVAEGRVGILLLAGGQGTRLGSSEPKGCFEVGLPSGKSLFQLQAERISKLQQLAAGKVFGKGAEVRKPLRWYIMTSPFTDADTKKHFEEHAYFGLLKSQVVFFQQGFLPCLTTDGKIILQTESKIAKAPDGNGGVYLALGKSGCLADMKRNGVECIDCYCVDNLLAKIGDPTFVGHCWEKGAQCGARVLKKNSEFEKVGVFAMRGGVAEVVEYSEMPKEAAEARDADGDFLYPWGNICMHYFTVAFLEHAEGRLSKAGKYHVAHKKIPSKDGDVQGIKLELFIFDTFPFADKVALFEVNRDEQFAPVKNARGVDSPQSARELLLSLHKRWIKEAGGSIDAKVDFQGEISPLVSYGGEGLESCKGVQFGSATPTSLDSAYFSNLLPK